MSPSIEPSALTHEDLQKMNPPVFQDYFIRVASMDPNLGFRLKTINGAIREAMEYMYWQHPKYPSKTRIKAA